MAITGLTLPIAVPVDSSRPDVDEAIDTTVKLFTRLDVISDEQSLRESLASEYSRLTDLGNGRLYVRLPAGITFERLRRLANKLATEHGYDELYAWPNFWVPGTEQESVTEVELNGDEVDYTARIALFCDDSDYDPLLWFTGLSYDDMHQDKGASTQLRQFTLKCAEVPDGTSLDFADERDFLVWYIMDLIRGVARDKIVLSAGFMRVQRHGRRTVCGGSCVGGVYSIDGQAELDYSRGRAHDGYGVGLSAGLIEA